MDLSSNMMLLIVVIVECSGINWTSLTRVHIFTALWHRSEAYACVLCCVFLAYLLHCGVVLALLTSELHLECLSNFNFTRYII